MIISIVVYKIIYTTQILYYTDKKNYIKYEFGFLPDW